jgi:two-component system, NtrC family, response regulator AtoC
LIDVISNSNRILGSSPQIQSLQKFVQQAALTDSPILLCGERGSGREFLAQVLHQSSSRKGEPLDKLNCLGWNEALLESELLRRIERTPRGTLFLDDVNEVPPRILSRSISAGPRIIGACDPRTDRHAYGMEFGIRITVPPLRERKLDIPVLVDHFIERFAAQFEKPVKTIHSSALRRLVAYDWPGNIRELRDAVERAVKMAVTEMLELSDFCFLAVDDIERPLQFKIPGATIQEIEREAITRTLEAVGGSTAMAAKILNMSVRKIQYKIKDYKEDKAQAQHA